MDSDAIYKWLDELARYFENRDTGGEDRAHWANVYNSESALKVKAALVASEAEVERMREALRQIAEAHHMMIEPDLKAIARAALTGEKL